MNFYRRRITHISGISICFCIFASASLPRDCADVQTKGSRYSGLYTVYPEGLEEGVEVFCDLNTEGGGWTVRREITALFAVKLKIQQLN